MAKPVLILGNGGHAQVIHEALELSGRQIAGHFERGDDFPKGQELELALGMGRRLARKLTVEKWHHQTFATVIHPTAIISPSAMIGEGAQILAGAIIGARSVIGKWALINTGAQVDHGCTVGDFAHICPGAILCGDVKVREHAMVGPGQVITRGKYVVHDVTGEEAYRMACP